MNLTDMRTIVRRDLHDEDSGNYRWTDDEIDRHVAHALHDFSSAIPDEKIAVKTTTASSRAIDISDITNRVTVEAVEYPVDQFPAHFQRFAVWGDVLTLLGREIPDGSDASPSSLSSCRAICSRSEKSSSALDCLTHP